MVSKLAPAPQFSADFLDQVRATLTAEKISLAKELAKFTKPNTDQSGDFTSNFPNFGDKEDENAAEVAEYAANLSLEQTLEKTLRDVISSLARLDKKQYGLCKYCQKPIDQRRLLARPISNSCVDCKKAITQEV